MIPEHLTNRPKKIVVNKGFDSRAQNLMRSLRSELVQAEAILRLQGEAHLKNSWLSCSLKEIKEPETSKAIHSRCRQYYIRLYIYRLTELYVYIYIELYLELYGVTQVKLHCLVD